MFGNVRIIRLAALSLALLTVAASAETFTIPLDLSGYPNIQFDIGRRFLSIQSVTFTCNGTMLAGLDYRGQPFSGQVVLWLRANPGYKIAEGPLAGQSTYPAAEPFTGQSSFRSLIGATWDFLLDGTGDGWFEIEPSLFVPEQQPLSLPSAAIQSAGLIIEATPVPTPIIYVDDDAEAPGDGRSWQTAYKYLQDALMMAVPPAEIRVAQGTYRPDLFALSDRPSLGRYETFQLINGVTLKGGYAGLTGEDPNSRDFASFETVLSGDLAENDVPIGDIQDFHNEASWADNTFSLIDANGVDASAVLEGFVLTAASGGAIRNQFAHPTIRNCTITGNISPAGAGMTNYGQSAPDVSNCTFSNNVAYIFCECIGGDDGRPPICGCVGGQGGAVLNYASSPRFHN